MSSAAAARSHPFSPTDTFRAAGMFWASIASLVFFAGLLHFLNHPITQFWCIVGALAIWPLYWVELAVNRRHGLRRLRWDLLYCLIPPLRLAARDPRSRTWLWLPGWGWQNVDVHLEYRLQKKLNAPMILLALSVLPIMLFEQRFSDHPRLQNLVIGANSLIWMLFTAEFILMCSISRNWLTYCKSHWVDLVIILLPLIEYLRILRLSRLARLQRLAKTTGQAYRLRSVAMKAWRALLLLEALQRLTAGTPEKRLAKLRRELEDCHALAARLEVDIRETEAQIARASLKNDTASEATVPSAVCDAPPP